jgi:hypothetical protein
MKCILLGRRRRCGIGDLIRFTHYEPIHGGNGEGDKQQKAFAEGKAREQRDGDGDAPELGRPFKEVGKAGSTSDQSSGP